MLFALIVPPGVIFFEHFPLELCNQEQHFFDNRFALQCWFLLDGHLVEFDQIIEQSVCLIKITYEVFVEHNIVCRVLIKANFCHRLSVLSSRYHKRHFVSHT